MYNPPPAGQPYGSLQPQEESDKLIAALAYILAPLMSIVILLTDMKNKPFLKYHAYLSLTLGLIQVILSVTVIGLCAVPFIFLAQLYYAYLAYARGTFTIPLVTDLTAKFFKDFPGGSNQGGAL